jgi:hypothetical protein
MYALPSQNHPSRNLRQVERAEQMAVSDSPNLMELKTLFVEQTPAPQADNDPSVGSLGGGEGNSCSLLTPAFGNDGNE